MTKQEIANEVLFEKSGIAKTADFLSAGLKKPDLTMLCSDGFLERVRHGFYRLADNQNLSEERLLAALIPEGIVCVESALFYYGYSDFAPREWSIAVPRTVSRTKIKTDVLNLHIYFISQETYETGKTTANINDVSLSIYDRERTICDCFKYRTKLDNEIFNKAVNAYALDEKKNLANLSKYAKEMGVYKKMMNVMEVLLNG